MFDSIRDFILFNFMGIEEVVYAEHITQYYVLAYIFAEGKAKLKIEIHLHSKVLIKFLFFNFPFYYRNTLKLPSQKVTLMQSRFFPSYRD